MLGIAERLGQMGGTAGTGLGGVLGGALGMIGDTLSAPRRMLWNAVGLPDSGAEVMGNLGMDKEGLPAQGLGFLLEAALDPLTYAGGLIGRLGGRAAGAMAGGSLEAKALARGPAFGGGLEKLAGAEASLAGNQQAGQARKLIESIKGSPMAERIMQEVPPGSQYLPGGNNALAFQTPAGDVLRMGTEARASIPEMLQPTRSVRAGDINIERLPFAARVGDKAVWEGNFKPMSASIREQGLHPADLHQGNIGLHNYDPVIIDPGAVVAKPGGLPLPLGKSIDATGRTGGLGDRLLDWFGADELLRQHLARVPGRAIPQ